ncbi:DUF5686 and carboxypeptidase regulatory-like domain-containing protein [Tellurirhabdus bombi]|uniref:DUF5686 and carboxypeptidase regulatory-like domain-containing protein n=1 Tax=Tellurirhabdus bombi TaxID=2907205 RepID=UPI001F452393|nr:DUF5686 and carboxypeptidase regulatory-like domain-containing protein [Tellurirhabdus bombi]
MKVAYWLFSLFLLPSLVVAQGIKGTVKTAKNEPLPYAAIVVKGSSNGTITNADGLYELPLQPGRYDITFQYLGFQSVQKSVEITSGFQTLDITLNEQAYRLDELAVGKGKEDPAYSIMRRAIAKSRIHEMQVQSYTAKVYTKASVTITDLPMEFLYKKQLKEVEKEANFKKGVPILNESVSEVTFKQPNQYKQKVIATRNSQNNDFPSPNQYFQTSFYRPEVAKAVSPLSPKAFAYYKFEYEGTFREQGVDVSKITVTPRSYGEGVFKGTLFIIENTWAIHSLQLETIAFQGFTVKVRQVFSPVQNVWMPVNQRYDIGGKVMGIGGNGQYIITQTIKDLKVNPAFSDEVQVVDEKVEKTASKLTKRDIKGKNLDQLIAQQKELTTKDMRRIMREYEKQDLKRQRDPETAPVSRSDSTTIDSLAAKRNTAFWDSLRTVPLTAAETKSYGRHDSLKIVRKIEVKRDSVKQVKTQKKAAKFQLGQLISGNTWRLNKSTSLIWENLIQGLSYNTVEGYVLVPELRLRYIPFRPVLKDSVTKKTIRPAPVPTWTLAGTGRYQFGRQKFIGYGTAGYQYKTTNITLSGGRNVAQFNPNPNEPISPALNTITSLLFERNFMKLYQKDFLGLNANWRMFDQKVVLNGSLEYAERSELENYREDLKPWINWKNRVFTPNRPFNAEQFTGFSTHQAVVFNLSASARLGATKYRLWNGRRVSSTNDSPLLMVNYRKGISGVAGSDVDYDFVQAQLSHSFETGIRSQLSYQIGGGAFLNDRSVFFPDFKHFLGNEFFLQQGDPTSRFRMLPYYTYSTGRRFLEGHVLIETRKFLLTQIQLARLAGLKEHISVHYLKTPASRDYTELVYGLDGLIPQVLPFFRLEVVTQWQAWKYQGLGFRIGTTLKFGR